MLVTSRKMNDIRHGMADYYTIIAKAVGGLDPNTGAARRRLYDRARVALVAEMRSARNGLDESDILAAQRSLEEAIGKMEADVESDECTGEDADAPLTYLPRGGVVEAPYPPANQNGEQPRSPQSCAAFLHSGTTQSLTSHAFLSWKALLNISNFICGGNMPPSQAIVF